MEKYCNNCDLVYEDENGTLYFCKQCGQMLYHKKFEGPEAKKIYKKYKEVRLESDLKHN